MVYVSPTFKSPESEVKKYLFPPLELEQDQHIEDYQNIDALTVVQSEKIDIININECKRVRPENSQLDSGRLITK